MTDKELRKLKRRDLLELLLEKTEENERLSAELEQTKRMLDQRQIAVANAGSLAEAALSINGMLTAADETARQYLDNLKDTEERCRIMTDNANREAERILTSAKKKALEMLTNADKIATKKQKTGRTNPDMSQNLYSDFDKAFEKMKKRNR